VPGAAIGIIGTGVDSTTDADEAGGMPPEECDSLDRHLATARKLATLCWHLVVGDQDYAFARPSLTDKKLRALELRAGMAPRRGRKGTAAAYSLKEVRRRERALTEQAEVAYRQLVAGWQPKRPATKPR
jgi:transposase